MRTCSLACALLAGCAAALLASCETRRPVGTGTFDPPPDPPRGHLLLIGGGLDDDNKPVYERFIALARATGGDAPGVVIATAASGDQAEAAKGKIESIRAYCQTCRIGVITRETPAAEAVALVDAASAMFFTGGDQKRITDRYLTVENTDTPEAEAMRRLLRRDGVIAGTSAGDAMMSDPMFLTGRSAEALGIRSTRQSPGPDDDAADTRPQSPLGPQIGKGMGFAPLVIADSHFFERHRFGRLVAALETGRRRLGIGVGEDACVEIDLATIEVRGVSVADSLLVDAGGVTRDGLLRRNVRTLVLRQGTVVSLPARLKAPITPAPAAPNASERVPVVEPGQNRQLASWRFFVRAQDTVKPTTVTLSLDGYEQRAWPDGQGWAVVEVGPATK